VSIRLPRISATERTETTEAGKKSILRVLRELCGKIPRARIYAARLKRCA
jgi:hypothetical protein